MIPATIARRLARRIASRGVIMASRTGSVVMLLELLPDDATMDDVAEIAMGLVRRPETAGVLMDMATMAVEER